MPPGNKLMGCWAHARRKFFDLQVSGAHPQAAEALRRIGKLYDIEEQARTMDHAARAQHRQQNSALTLTDMHEWLIRLRVVTADGSGLARAIDYSLHRWGSLIRYAQTGNLPIDNNPVENAIRPIAIGKKNWLFAGSERADKRAAAIQYKIYSPPQNLTALSHPLGSTIHLKNSPSRPCDASTNYCRSNHQHKTSRLNRWGECTLTRHRYREARISEAKQNAPP